MLKSNFHKLKYPRYRVIKNEFYIREFIGFDTEALKTGKPFLLCDSTGKVYRPKCVLKDLLRSPEKRIDFATFNLKYDSGAILYYLPHKNKRELWKDTKTSFKGLKLEYIPHKLLRIKAAGKTRNFWDVQQFYKSSLEVASSKYLNKHKKEIGTKKFSYSYARKHRAELFKYCLVDCRLTAGLGNLLLKTLLRFDIKPRNFYSRASISFEYFLNKCGYINVFRFWKYRRELLRFANDSYFGGKFEVIARGKFNGYEYDITSAYGKEIADLLDIRYARAYYTRKYSRKAVYSFIKVIINNKNGVPIPCTYKRANLNIYPAGKFRATITKNEYLYLRRHKVPVKFLSAWNLKFSVKEYPYRKEIRKLHRIKEKYRKSNLMLSQLAKYMINTFCGKFAQIIEQPGKNPRAAMGWNPIYSAVVLANVRIRVTELQVKLGADCLGVHTDSIITTRKMPAKFTSPGLGSWKLEESGDGVIIACGIFQVGKDSRNRGFHLDKKHSWLPLLAGMKNRKTMSIKEVRVLTWLAQIADNKNTDINLFTKVKKRFNLNCERKRIWTESTTAKKLLTGLDYSAPPVIMDYLKPRKVF